MDRDIILKITGALTFIYSLASFISIPFIYNSAFLYDSSLKIFISTLVSGGHVILDNGLSYILFGLYSPTTKVALLGAGIYLIIGIYYYWVGRKKRKIDDFIYWSATLYLANLGVALIAAFLAASYYPAADWGQGLIGLIIPATLLQGASLFLFLLGIATEVWDKYIPARTGLKLKKKSSRKK